MVLASSIPNALALPGGKIYLLNGLLQKAEGPDEIAGVIAHEMGHVAHRDQVRVMIQNGGTSFLIGLLFGDVTGSAAAIFAARSLVDASYSRQAESNADAFAIETMHALGRSPAPMGELLFASPAQKATKPSEFWQASLTEQRRELMWCEDCPGDRTGNFRRRPNCARSRTFAIPRAPNSATPPRPGRPRRKRDTPAH